VRLMSASPIFC